MKRDPIAERTAQIVLLLIRVALNEEHKVDKSALNAAPIDWKGVYKLATAQGVVAIAWDALMKLHKSKDIDIAIALTRELRLKWALSVERIESMRKMPVSGACMTPLISPHMPSMAKLHSGTCMPRMP